MPCQASSGNLARLAGLVALLGVFGCQGEVSAPKASNPDLADAESVESPKTLSPGRLALIAHGDQLKVGNSLTNANQLFPRPKTAFEFTDLPQKFLKPYRSKGWESAREGFGVILFREKIVAALWHIEKATREEQDRLVKKHQSEIPVPSILVPGKHVSYWFWEDAGQRLMICSSQGQGGFVRLTAAIGDDVVMDALKISPDQARKDRDELDRAVDSKPTAKGSTPEIR